MKCQMTRNVKWHEMSNDMKCQMTWNVKSKCLKGRSVPRVSHVFADAKDFVVFLFPDTFRIQGILLFPCFWTLSVFKGFCRFPVSRHFPYSRNFVVFPFPDTFRNQWPPCHSVPPAQNSWWGVGRVFNFSLFKRFSQRKVSGPEAVKISQF